MVKNYYGHNGRNLATDGLHILAVTMTIGNSHMKHVRARLPLVSQTVTFPRQFSNSSLRRDSLGRPQEPPSFR
jgi:hypothetical protein